MAGEMEEYLGAVMGGNATVIEHVPLERVRSGERLPH